MFFFWGGQYIFFFNGHVIMTLFPYFWFQDSILDELDKEESTHDSVSQESESEEDGIHVDAQKALALKEKVLFRLAVGSFR